MRFPLCIETHHLFPPWNESDVASYEAVFGRTFPEDYRAFLSEWNGLGFIKEDLRYPFDGVFDLDSWGNLSFVYGMQPGNERYDIVQCQTRYRFNERVPGGIITIGDNNSWEQACLSLRAEDFGTVYRWNPGDPSDEPDGNVPTMDWLRRVAGSFTEFWTLLVPDSKLDEYD